MFLVQTACQIQMRSVVLLGPLAEVLCLGCRVLILEVFTMVQYAHLCILCSRDDLSWLQRSAEFSVALSKCVRSLFPCFEMAHCCVGLAGLVLAV